MSGVPLSQSCSDGCGGPPHDDDNKDDDEEERKGGEERHAVRAGEEQFKSRFLAIAAGRRRAGVHGLGMLSFLLAAALLGGLFVRACFHHALSFFVARRRRCRRRCRRRDVSLTSTSRRRSTDASPTSYQRPTDY